LSLKSTKKEKKTGDQPQVNSEKGFRLPKSPKVRSLLGYPVEKGELSTKGKKKKKKRACLPVAKGTTSRRKTICW